MVMTVKNKIVLEEVEDMINETEFYIKICNSLFGSESSNQISDSRYNRIQL